MKGFFKWGRGIIIAVAVIFIAGGFVLPGDVVMERQIEIAAPPEKVFAIVGDRRRFNEFSPWAGAMGSAQASLEPPVGTGTGVTWNFKTTLHRAR